MKDKINLILGKNLCTNDSLHVAELHREKVKASFQHHCCPSIAPRVKKRRKEITERSTVTYCYTDRWIPGRGEEKGRMGRPWTIFWPFVCILCSPLCINSLLRGEWNNPVCEASADAAAPPSVCVELAAGMTAAGVNAKVVERWGGTRSALAGEMESGWTSGRERASTHVSFLSVSLWR